MAQKDIESLREQAQEIRDETVKKANTATRVGTMHEDQNDSAINAAETSGQSIESDFEVKGNLTGDTDKSGSATGLSYIQKGYVDSVDAVQDGRLDNLEDNQFTSAEVYSTLNDEGGGLSFLPRPGTLLVSYKVSNDPDPDLNGYYHWDSGIVDYIKDADLDAQTKSDIYDVFVEDVAELLVDSEIIPSKSNSLVWLDGTIIESGGDFYFKDQSNNSRDFLITDYDFPSDWTLGFPFKSAATISAPAADATLIAADINGYLYTGGVPNEICIVSIPQNIDFENKIYARRIEPIYDSNGIEISEGKIVDFVVYDSIRGNGKLLICDQFFSVPTEVDEFWVDPDGNDTTGDGSKALPWLTINKADNTVNDGSNINVKSNDAYLGDTGLGYLYNTLSNNIQVIGRAVVRNTGTAQSHRVRFNDKTYLRRLTYIPDNSLTNAIVWLQDAADIELERLYLKGSALYALRGFASKVNELVIKGTFSNVTIFMDAASVGDFKIENSFIDSDAPYLGNPLNQGAFEVTNCRIRGNYTNVFWNTLASGLNQIILEGNVFDVQSASKLYQQTINTAQPAKINNNTFGLLNGMTSDPILIQNSTTSEAEINGNKITDIDGYGELGHDVVSIVDARATFNNNIMHLLFSNADTGAEYAFKKVTAGVIAEAIASNNKILSKRNGNYHIAIGLEATTTGDDTITLPMIEKNYVRSGAFYDHEYASKIAHISFISFQKNGHTRYNNLGFGGYGTILKGSNTEYTSGGVYYNIFKNNALFGAYIKGCNGVNVVNNTIVYDEVSPGGAAIGLYANTGGDDASNCVVKNNIIIYLGTGNFNAIQTEAGTGNVFDYNLYYCPNGTLRFLPNGVEKTFAEWQGLGNDLNGAELTDAEFQALFIDFDNEDYALAEESIAIGAGEDLGASYDEGFDTLTDWGGNDELQTVVLKAQTGSWDIGAYIS